MSNKNNALELIKKERERQRNVEGWGRERDDNLHCYGQMADAAACYAANHIKGNVMFAGLRKIFHYEKNADNFAFIELWPWGRQWDKRNKHPRIKQLVIAAALIVAEIERLQRKEDKDKSVTNASLERN